MFGRSKSKKVKQEPGAITGPSGYPLTARGTSSETERTLTPGKDELSRTQLHRATRTRKTWALITSFLLFVTIVFMILVEIGNTKASSTVLNNIYFLRIDVSDIFAETVPDASISNSIAQTLGLHDFYQFGLWNYCEGYNVDGVTNCSKPHALYWFDPVSIILNELLAGATITLPTEVTDILNLIRLVSHWMFGLFLSGTCLAFVMIFITPLSIYSRWPTIIVSIFTFLAALLITAASVIGTALSVIAKNAFTSQTELNIGANVGLEMFIFMWIASGAAIIAWLIQMGLCCCCASRRDVKTGRKRGNKKAWGTGTAGVSEKPRRGGLFGRRRKEEV